MRVSREKKQENAERFIDAFVAEVRKRGYDAVSLRDVARAAGMSDGAIYKHFPTKEKILLTYYAVRMDRLKDHGASLATRPDYTFVERMHALLEFQIGQYEGEKDFLAKTFRPTFISASLMWGEVAAMRKTYVETVRGLLAQAEAKGEIPALALPYVVEEMVWCHYVAVMLYWQRDASDRHDDTTQFIDRTLKVFSAVVGGPLLPMAQDLVGFLINRHLMPLLMELGGVKPGATWSSQPFPGPDAAGKTSGGAGGTRAKTAATAVKAAGTRAGKDSKRRPAKPGNKGKR
ncbi:MAG: TetR/AcrR family transcriptional regulator [Fibrobacteres bacterium]|jgi:AcrR family transcriptional regulator|nr:TetR/AcrR family transcriptional regulator [Fibrobacterota bacterium]